jgi:Cu-Zn family superoxide dismutase
MPSRLVRVSIPSFVLAVTFAGRAEPVRHESPSFRIDNNGPVEPPRTTIETPIEPKSGSSLRGRAVFTELPEGGVKVVIEVANVSPGKHGVHIHEKGDCSASDASSAGDHFDPDGHPHGLPPTAPRHIGDFGNIDVRPNGEGRLEIVAPRANLRLGDPHSFVGRSIIVHAKPDDGSQPSGNAGERIGCGEIRR